MKRKIAGRIERLRRIHQVFLYLAKGWTDSEIIAKCREDYNIGQSMTYKYMQKAKSYLTKKMQENMEDSIANITSQLKRAADIALEKKDMQNYRGALMDLAKINGLLTQRIDMNINNQDEYADTDADEIEAALEAITH